MRQGGADGIMPAAKAIPPSSKRVGKEDVMSQETVPSVDNTPIAYWRSGEGPPLVLVHGTAADHGRWTPVLPAFEERRNIPAVNTAGAGAAFATIAVCGAALTLGLVQRWGEDFPR